MTQRELDRELAQMTGESMSTIRNIGFSLVEPPEREPLTVDWDALAAQRIAVFPDRGRSRERRAA
jgi:hypothetical protein